MGTFDDEHPGEPWLYGVASRAELLAAGVGGQAIQHRLRSGRYLRLYEGVYAIGHADLTVAGRRRAIVLACGVAEVDGYAYHRTRAAFQTDRARDRAALSRGWRVARFTAAEVLTDPAAVAAELRDVL